MNPLTTLQGKLTKTTLGVAAVLDLIQQGTAFAQGEEVQSVIVAAEAASTAVAVLVTELVIAWGAFRALINYGGKGK